MPEPGAVRTELLRRLTDYAMEHGIGEASLRPLAAAVGTNARMLIYHFNSKEQLLVELVEEVRLRHHEAFRRWLEEHSEDAEQDLLTYLWNWASARRLEPLHRTFFECCTLSWRNPIAFSSPVRRLAGEWSQMLEASLIARGVRAPKAKALAAAGVDSVRGLLLDLLTSGDRTRINAAAHELCSRWKQQAGRR